MEEVGSVSVGRTQFLRKMYVYRCVRQPGLALEFVSVNGTGDAYRCLQCKRFNKNRSLTIVNDAIVPGRQHPEDGHHEECKGVPLADVESRQLDREMRDAVRTTGKRPREAFTDMMCTIPKRYKSEELQQQVIINCLSYSSVRRQLSRHRAQRCTPIPDPLNIPDLLRTTLRGREADDGSQHKDERFLLYTGQNGKLPMCLMFLRDLIAKSFECYTKCYTSIFTVTSLLSAGVLSASMTSASTS